MANVGSWSAHRAASFVCVVRERITSASSALLLGDETEQRTGVGCSPKQVTHCRERQVLTLLKVQSAGEEIQQNRVAGNEDSELLVRAAYRPLQRERIVGNLRQ